MREVILDTETTGLEPSSGHRIVEIGAIEMINKVVTGNKFHYYVNPERSMPSEAYRIHGISSEFLQDKPLFSKVAQEFLSFIGNSVLVIHNAPFDMKFINYELSKLNLPSLDINNTIDTLNLARKIFPGMKVNLDALCKRYNVDNSTRQFHGALKDAILLAEVYVELTGGRQGKFNIGNILQHSVSNINNLANNLQKFDLKVTKPNAEETNSHQELIDRLGIDAKWKKYLG